MKWAEHFMPTITVVMEGGDVNLPPTLLMTTPLRHMAVILSRRQLEEGTGLAMLVEGLCIPLLRQHVASAVALVMGTWVWRIDADYGWIAAPGEYDALTLLVIDAHQSEHHARSVRRQLDEGPRVGEWTELEHYLTPPIEHIQRALRGSLN